MIVQPAAPIRLATMALNVTSAVLESIQIEPEMIPFALNALKATIKLYPVTTIAKLALRDFTKTRLANLFVCRVFQENMVN